MAATDARRRSTWGGRFRLLVRVLGLTGLVASAAGAVVLSTVYGWPESQAAAEETARSAWASASEGGGDTFTRVASVVLVAGLAGVVVALVVELLGGLFLVAGRRTAGGVTATLATAAAVALLVFVNLESLSHHRRYDLTRDARFTLPAGVADDLRRLRADSPTTVVVFQQHKTAGSLSGKPDSYDYAAERKVVEKVTDLVDQFRAFGPRFRVAVLDVEDEGYERQLADLTKEVPELKAAVEAAPENSIFFAANGRVQRLGFNEFLALDKTASKAADGGRGNLVLMPQGVERFARRVLAVQERRPKAAIAVVHGYLGTTGPDTFTLAGLKKTLTEYGFDVTDIVLRKGWGEARSLSDLKPAAYTQEEFALDELEGELEEAGNRARAARAEAAVLDQVRGLFGKLSGRPFRERVRFYVLLSEDAKNRGWLEVTGVYRKWAEGITEETEKGFRADLEAAVGAQRVKAEQEVGEAEKARRAADDKLAAALKDERPIQDRRLTDVKAKLSRLLSDVDLLIVPRFTIASVTSGRTVDPQLHALSAEQTEVVRDFMKAGKPVLALLGPVPGEDGNPAEPDGFEKLLAERGIELGKDTVLFDAEGRALAAFGAGGQFGGAGPADIPPLAVEDRTGGEAVGPNPVGEAVRATGRAVGAEQKLDIRARALRPVYVAPGWQARLPFAAEFLLTGADSWNEAKPFAVGDRAGRITYVPRFDPPAKRTGRDDLGPANHAEERRGPFPVGVAVEGKPPA
ncbi:MAG: GldG family protein, partial [Gemmataceae bacterium]|nr:GldG family protein [Gemmataceae bacterium]